MIKGNIIKAYSPKRLYAFIYSTLKFTIAVVNGYLSLSITQPVAVVKAASQAIIIVIPIIFYLYQASTYSVCVCLLKPFV